jgi:REP element-mobilizing transposase RayT
MAIKTDAASFFRSARKEDPGSAPVSASGAEPTARSGVGESVSLSRAADLGSARASRAVSGAPPETPQAIYYSKRRLPHFERPWGKYAVSFSTHDRRHLSAVERDCALQSLLYAHEHNHYELYVGCVMPDHVHLLFEPQIKEDAQGKTIFWSLTEILHGIKSSSAHRINKAREASGPVWERESFDRFIRSEADFQEKFRYICKNPWDAGVAGPSENYPWLWTPDISSAGAPKNARGARALPKPPSSLRQDNAERSPVSGLD